MILDDFNTLISWSLASFSHLPWRENRTLYRTLVSEIMLQQTTVSTVLGRFNLFMEEFPSLSDLASASEEELTVAWKGLGYYRRARNLRLAAQYFLEEEGGVIPGDYHRLLKAPGIGEYTASALLAIGQNKVSLPLDANLERVLARFYLIKGPKGPALMKKIRARFQEELILKEMHQGEVSPRELSEAFMDLGRMICSIRKPRCIECPLKNNCKAYEMNEAEKYPEVSSSNGEKKKSYELELLRILVRKNEKVLVYKKGSSKWLAGQFETPTYVIKSDDQNFKQYPYLRDNRIPYKKEAASFKTAITHYKITNYVWELTEDQFLHQFGEFPEKVNYRPVNVEKENFATSLIKILKNMEKSKLKKKV